MEAQAILFDLDGVLTDTAHYHYLAWKKLADSLGFHFNEKDNERLKGVDRMRSFEIVLEINDALDQFDQEARIRYADEKNEWYKKLIEQIKPADILPGISRFLDQAKQKGMKLAVASSSKNAKRVLELLGITDCFDYVANAAHIAKSKPAPDIFLDCARGLGVLPEQCIGVEDACRLILFEDDGVALYVDLHRVFLGDVQSPPQLDRQNNATKLINFPYDPC